MKPYQKPNLDAYYSTPAPVTYNTVRTIPRVERKVDSSGPVRVIVRDGRPAWRTR